MKKTTKNASSTTSTVIRFDLDARQLHLKSVMIFTEFFEYLWIDWIEGVTLPT